MKIIFFLPNGVVEYPIAENLQSAFNFNAVASSIRINGFFLADNLYIRHSQIVGMAFEQEEGAQPVVRRDLN